MPTAFQPPWRRNPFTILSCFPPMGRLTWRQLTSGKFELLNWLERVTCYSVSIGLGNGETAIDARHNAFRAMLRAKITSKMPHMS